MNELRGRGGYAFRGGRGGYANRGRAPRKAEMRTATVKIEQTNSARRLQRDYKELIEAREPLVGVAAKPLSNSMYVWHGNIKGPVGSKWETGVFHFKMTFPQTYPANPPKIELFTSIPHPNVFGTQLCLDMLTDASKPVIY
jgi:ubiquitin-protein ligase